MRYNNKPQIQSLTAEDIQALQTGKKKLEIRVGLQTPQGTVGRYRGNKRPSRRTMWDHQLR